MRERPILFSAPMVRAILEGWKTQTRRVVKNPDNFGCLTGDCPHQLQEECDAALRERCPYGLPGDLLWVRETCIISPKRFDGVRSDSYNATDPDGDGRIVQYLASTPDTDAARDYGLKVTPSIFMPRWASRITLTITNVRVERLQDISRGDAMAEGCPFPNMETGPDPRQWYAELWDQINGIGAWESNPWVWVVSFDAEGAR